jgi:hypothetical protein
LESSKSLSRESIGVDETIACGLTVHRPLPVAAVSYRTRRLNKKVRYWKVQAVPDSVPRERHTAAVGAAITVNYTTVLNIVFGVAFAILTVVFFKTSGPDMMRMMEGGKHDRDSHEPHGAHRHAHHHHSESK